MWFYVINTLYTIGVIILSMLSKEMCVHALKGLVLPRTSHSGVIACASRLQQRRLFERTLLSHKQKTVA